MDEAFRKRLMLLEDALTRITTLPRSAGLFGAQQIAKRALAGEPLPDSPAGETLADPRYYARVRRALEKNWYNRCAYCGASGETTTLEIEHSIPASRGGTDNPNNLLLSCHDCNQRKGTQTLEEFGRGDLRLKLIGQTLP